MSVRSVFIKIIKAHPFLVLPVLLSSALLGGCASNLKNLYSDVDSKIESGDYKAAAATVDKSKGKYGKKNVLLYYLDSGMTNHLAGNYKKSLKSFEAAKEKFDQYYQKSVSAGAASFMFNDSALPYYGENYERVYINIFQSLNYIKESDVNEAVVEARQANNLFRTFAVEKNRKNFYNDDGFIRYFMGLVYENGGYINDAHVSYYLALKAYKNGISGISPPRDLVNDAYTTALLLEMPDRAARIKEDFPQAEKSLIPKGFGELVIVDYNGAMPRKTDNILEFALFDIWPYVNQVEVDTDEAAEFEKARSVSISIFAKDYVKVVFPQYKRVPNKVKTFSVKAENISSKRAYEAQNLAEIAEKCLQNDIKKVYAKTLARAAVKYVVGKSVSKAVDDSTGDKGWGTLTQIGFNIFNSLTASADKRGWRTLPENILMSRIYLPAGENKVRIDYLGPLGEKLFSETFSVNIENGKKTFKILRSSM